MTHGWVWVGVVLVTVACGTSGKGTPAATAGASGAGTVGVGGDDDGTLGGANGGGAGAVTSGGTSGGASSSAGRAGDGGSVGGAVGSRCTTSQPFGKPHAIAELNTADHEAGARLTSDELSVVFLRQNGTDLDQVWLAQRKNRADAFGAPTPIVSPQGGVPWISDDALTLWYEDTLGIGVHASHRPNLQASFPETPQIPTLLSYGDPYVVGGQNGHLYLALVSRGQVQVSKLNGWEPGEPEPLPGADVPRGVRPVVTSDELTLYLCSAPPAGSGRKDDIWVQQRATANEPFGAAINVAELNTSPFSFPSWISPDGCRLYFDAGDVTRDLYVAERN